MESRPAPDNEIFSGAGVLPYTVHDGQLLFLFHMTSQGRKEGTLIDFGGAIGAETDPIVTAAREFVEETFACATADHSVDEMKEIATSISTEVGLQESEFVQRQITSFAKRLRTAVQATAKPTSFEPQTEDRACWPLALRGEVANIWKGAFDRYYMFFMYIDWKPAENMTAFFEYLSSKPPTNGSTEAKAKMRKFIWIPASHILDSNSSPPLYIRVSAVHHLNDYVRRLQNAAPIGLV